MFACLINASTAALHTTLSSTVCQGRVDKQILTSRVLFLDMKNNRLL